MAKAIVQNFLILLCFISFYDFFYSYIKSISESPQR